MDGSPVPQFTFCSTPMLIVPLSDPTSESVTSHIALFFHSFSLLIFISLDPCLFLTFFLPVIYLWGHCMSQNAYGCQRIVGRIWWFPSIIWIPSTKLRVSDLVTITFTCRDIPLALFLILKFLSAWFLSLLLLLCVTSETYVSRGKLVLNIAFFSCLLCPSNIYSLISC